MNELMKARNEMKATMHTYEELFRSKLIEALEKHDLTGELTVYKKNSPELMFRDYYRGELSVASAGSWLTPYQLYFSTTGHDDDGRPVYSLMFYPSPSDIEDDFDKFITEKVAPAFAEQGLKEKHKEIER